MRRSTEVQLTFEVWKEGRMFVAYVPQLDLSSCGSSPEEAKKNITEAAEAFLEETVRMGTLQEVLEEAGFSFDQKWSSPEIVAWEKTTVAF